ncbi:MAG: hypothetical protein QNJ78_02010 [Gammaproteobacteria bacterium]|nr:hypothetical protein [Gammaproteobacteria bacterium]
MQLVRHQKVAIGLYLFTVLYLFARDDFDRAVEQSLGLFLLLLGIIFYRQLAYLAGFGFPEVFAKDYGSENHPGPYALLFWIIFLLAWSFVFFQ